MVFLTSKEQKTFQREKVRECVREISPTSRYCMMDYKIQSNSQGRIDNVCESTFRKVWCISKNRMNVLKREIKDGIVQTERCFNDKSKVPEKTLGKTIIIIIAAWKHLLRLFLALMGMAAQRYGFEFNKEEISMMSLPSGFKAASAYSWMIRYFSCVGDEEPNTGEIHLDPIEEKEVWNVFNILRILISKLLYFTCTLARNIELT
jgi:hypothetical protein